MNDAVLYYLVFISIAFCYHSHKRHLAAADHIKRIKHELLATTTRMARYWKILALALALAAVPSATQTHEEQQPSADASDAPSDSSDSTPAASASAHEHAHTEPDAVEFVSWEVHEDDATGQLTWTRIKDHDRHAAQSPHTATDASASTDPPSLPPETVDELIAQVHRTGGSIEVSPDSPLGETLQQLVDSARQPASYRVWLDDDDIERSASPREPPELTDAFLDIEKLIQADGFTSELIAALQVLAHDQNDPYAHEALAYMTLFEPRGADAALSFADAFASLRIAADAGVTSAMSSLALLNQIDFGVARTATVSDGERYAAAASVLEQLAAHDDDTAASLAVAYRHLRDFLATDSAYDAAQACNSAVRHYHRCAEDNVHALADKASASGGQSVARLSDEWLPASTFLDADQDVALADAAQRFEYYRTLAGGDAGDPEFAEAAEFVGQAYYYGDAAAGVAQDHAVAATYFARAADAGDAQAQANYGMMLTHGAGIAQNNASALRYFRAAAAQGNAFAHYGLGLLFLHGGGAAVPQNETLGVLYLERAAELGYVEAHTSLGAAYLHGHGVAKNATLAYEHFATAATESPTPLALFNLAVVQFRGIGTPASCDLAVHHFRAVALYPDALADLPFSLAMGYACYAAGDYVRAFLHYRLVADFGDEDAQTNAAYLLETYGDVIYPMGHYKDTDDSTRAGTSDTTTSVPWMNSTKVPLADAFALYDQAAALNDTEGMRRTALCYYDAWHGVCERNRSRALETYARAAALGDAEAAYTCGLMLALGDGVARDVSAAKVRSLTVSMALCDAIPGLHSHSSLCD